MKKLTMIASAMMALSVSAASATENTLVDYKFRFDECVAGACQASSTTTAADIRALLEVRNAAVNEGTGGSVGRVDLNAGDTVITRGSSTLHRRSRTGPQVMFLDFDDEAGSPFFEVDVEDGRPGSPTFGDIIETLTFEDRVFTQEDRDIITARVAADYAPYDVTIVQEAPTSGEFATITMADNDRQGGATNITLFRRSGEVGEGGSFGFSILFGRADEIDFGNDNYSGGAFVDTSFWTLIAEMFPAALGSFTGLPLSETPTEEEIAAVIKEAVINQSANTGAHEVGHSVGLRHHDALGAPGRGLPPTFDPTRFLPVSELPLEGVETFNHIMASGASVGLPLQASSSADRFFSERSAIKLTFNNLATVFNESFFDRGRVQIPVVLRTTRIENPIVEGENSGRFLLIKSALIEGNIERAEGEEPENDTYTFFGRRGKFMNFEINSFTDFNIVDPMISTMRLYKIERDGSRTQVAFNDDTFEPFDPFIIDFEVLETAKYELEIETPNLVAGAGNFSLDGTGNGALREGDYDLHVYEVDRALGSR